MSTPVAKPQLGDTPLHSHPLPVPTSSGHGAAHTIKGLLKGHMNTYSPVCHNGSFECDRVIKSGQVLKRTRKTKSWKTIYLVIRPDVLSMYKDSEGTKLRHRISLSDVTAIARQRDPKGNAKHVFGIFTPQRNFHIDAHSDLEAQEWVDTIRGEARIDEEEDELLMDRSRPTRATLDSEINSTAQDRQIYSSSSEPESHVLSSQRHANSPYGARRLHSATRKPSRVHEYSSANEAGSFSDFSDFPGSTTSLSLPAPNIGQQLSADAAAIRIAGTDAVYNPSRPQITRRGSGQSTTNGNRDLDDERVVYHGYLYLLRSRNGIKKWKRYWCVLRPKCVGLYKDDTEYSAMMVIPFPTVLNAVEIDSQSRTKTHCFQIITEERGLRFCALSENELAKWLGALKSLLAKRKERIALREATATTLNAATGPENTANAAVQSSPPSNIKGKGAASRNVSFGSATELGGRQGSNSHLAQSVPLR